MTTSSPPTSPADLNRTARSTKKDIPLVRSRQDPLRKRYTHAPEEAFITDRARTTGGAQSDPFHGRVVPGSEDYRIVWPFGIHHAVGGDHDLPNPGDILCAALAACMDSTFRMITDRLGITLTSLDIDVTAELDVRGTLVVDRTVPVGFQSMHCHIAVQAAEGTDPRLMQTALAAAEHSCVVFQTLRSGVPIHVSTD